jgi:hypothetical protein
VHPRGLQNKDVDISLGKLKRDEETKWALSLKLSIFKKGGIIRIIFTLLLWKASKEKDLSA